MADLHIPARSLTDADPPSGKLVAEFTRDAKAAAARGVPAAKAVMKALKLGRLTQIRPFRMVDADHPALECYVMMISVFQDSTLMRLAKSCLFPRGFPALWVRSGTTAGTVSFGFRPKFSNDDMSGPTFGWTPDELVASLKWSGCLGQLLPFRHPITGELRWTSTTKNSADCYTMDIAAASVDAWAKVVTPGLLEELVDTGRHLCAEVLLDCDKVHGHDYTHAGSTVVITACGRSNRWGDADQPDAPVVFDDIAYLADLCKRHGLMAAPALRVKGPEACTALLQALDTDRDLLDADKFLAIAERLERDHGAVEYGRLRDHLDVCGKVLEGWVLMGKKAGMKTYEVRKYKLPAYTIRTMFVRSVMGGINLLKANLAPIDAYKMLMAYVHRWTTTHAEFWTHAGWEIYSRWREAGCPRRRPGDGAKGLPAPHIAFADQWEKEDRAIRPDIQTELDRIRDTAPVLVAPFVVYTDQVEAVAKAMVEAGMPVTTEIKKRGVLSTKTPTVYILAEKPGKRLNDIQTVVYRTLDIKGLDAPRIDPDPTKAVEVLFASDCVIHGGAGVEAIERKLREATDALVARVCKHVADHPDERIIVLPVAPQCTGKTTAAKQIAKILGADNVTIVSADVEMARLSEDGSFNPSFLSMAHGTCVRQASVSTKQVVVVDNTNFPSDTGAYDLVGRANRRTVLRIPYAVDVWSSGSDDRDMLQALFARNVRRAKLTISPEAIIRTVDRFANGLKQAKSVEAWLATAVPTPPAKPAMVYCNGAQGYVSKELTDMAMALAEDGLRLSDYLNKIGRDGYGEFHITVLSPAEAKKHAKAKFEPKTAPTLVGLGLYSSPDGYAWYIVADWPEAAAFREELHLPRLDFHCTLGFGDTGDVHGVCKDRSTLVAQ